MADAADAIAGTDPDRVSFAIALNTARGKIDRTTYKATIDIVVFTASLTADSEP